MTLCLRWNIEPHGGATSDQVLLVICSIIYDFHVGLGLAFYPGHSFLLPAIICINRSPIPRPRDQRDRLTHHPSRTSLSRLHHGAGRNYQTTFSASSYSNARSRDHCFWANGSLYKRQIRSPEMVGILWDPSSCGRTEERRLVLNGFEGAREEIQDTPGGYMGIYCVGEALDNYCAEGRESSLYLHSHVDLNELVLVCLFSLLLKRYRELILGNVT